MIDPGLVGSPIDVVTFVTALVTLKRVRESQDDGHAVTIALCECIPGVDEDRARADLEVGEADVDQYLVADGGESES